MADESLEDLRRIAKGESPRFSQRWAVDRLVNEVKRLRCDRDPVEKALGRVRRSFGEIDAGVTLRDALDHCFEETAKSIGSAWRIARSWSDESEDAEVVASDLERAAQSFAKAREFSSRMDPETLAHEVRFIRDRAAATAPLDIPPEAHKKLSQIHGAATELLMRLRELHEVSE